MDRNEQIAPIIRGIFRQKEFLVGIPEEQDFFDHGLSSLSVIEMQILIEDALKIAAPTSDLMRYPTISDWIGIYTREANASNGIMDAGVAYRAAQGGG